MKEKGRCKSGRGRYNGEPVTSRNLCHPRNCGLKQLPVIGLVTQTVPARLPQARGQPQVSRAQLPVSWQPPPSASSSLLCDSPSWSCPSWSTQQREARGAGRLAPGSGRSAISSAFFCAGWLVGPVRSRAGEQISVQVAGAPSGLHRAVAATNPHAHRGQASWAVSWATAPAVGPASLRSP